MTCTWKGCDKESHHTKTGRDGKTWAELCDDHMLEFEAAVIAGAKPLARAWVLAQGGAKEAAKRMQPSVDAGVRLIEALGALRK